MAIQLAETPYGAEASALVIGIEEKVQGILKRQEETADRPSEHIRAYRQGISLINTIREDVLALERLQQDTSGGGRISLMGLTPRMPWQASEILILGSLYLNREVFLRVGLLWAGVFP